jgi:HEAT repeat protein
MTTLRDSGEWSERVQAARDLRSIRGDAVTQALLGALRDPSAEVATAAVSALGARAEPRVADALREVIVNREGYFASVTRAAAVTTVAAWRNEAEMKPVLDAVNDLDAEVSLSAIAAIANHVPHAAITGVLPVLQDRSGYFLPIVRLAAAHALVRVGAVFESLRAELLEGEPDPKVRAVFEAGAPL